LFFAQRDVDLVGRRQVRLRLGRRRASRRSLEANGFSFEKGVQLLFCRLTFDRYRTTIQNRLNLVLAWRPVGEARDDAMGIDQGGYALDSGSPNGLWFVLSASWVDDPVVRDGIDRDGLLRQAEEEFASTS